jgi:hypothetical protein
MDSVCLENVGCFEVSEAASGAGDEIGAGTVLMSARRTEFTLGSERMGSVCGLVGASFDT